MSALKARFSSHVSLPVRVPALSGTATVPELTRPIFISDLHLTGDKKKTLACFWWFLRTKALEFNELIILGDLFEYWIGDDAAQAAEPIAKWLRAYAGRGKRIYMMQGNRDFMLGEAFARHCRATLLKSQVIVSTSQRKRILLAHGDEWCTLDAQYQAFRAKMRDPEFQKEGLAMSVAARIDFARRARENSETEKVAKTPEMMDVVPESVLADCRKYDVDCVIHGHTHRAGTYRYAPEGITRVVIPDWDMESGTNRHRGWVELNSRGMPQVVLTDKWTLGCL